MWSLHASGICFARFSNVCAIKHIAFSRVKCHTYVQSTKHISVTSQIAKTLDQSTSFRHRSNVKVSGRCLIDVGPMIFVSWVHLPVNCEHSSWYFIILTWRPVGTMPSATILPSRPRQWCYHYNIRQHHTFLSITNLTLRLLWCHCDAKKYLPLRVYELRATAKAVGWPVLMQRRLWRRWAAWLTFLLRWYVQ